MINCFDGKYAFLSNFYESPCDFEGILYTTVEHAFQAAKTLDRNERLKIAVAETPGKAKRMGRSVTLRPDWEEIKIDVMRQCLHSKFKDPDLVFALLDTGDEELVEGNTWHDNCWGNCTCEQCVNKPGENKLGKLLMEIRKEFRQA